MRIRGSVTTCELHVLGASLILSLLTGPLHEKGDDVSFPGSSVQLVEGHLLCQFEITGCVWFRGGV